MKVNAYAVDGATEKFHPYQIIRRNVGDLDVEIDILFAGICHSDIHQCRNEWFNSVYPMVPGHEIVGRIGNVGSKVTKFKKGDIAGVGCFVDSCRECTYCQEHVEQFCTKGCALTYNSLEMDKKTRTYGGYSEKIVVDEKYAIKVSEKFQNLAAVAPLLCAGITTYSPINAFRNKVGPGKKVGVVGLGGLGHMGVKFAVAFGAEVTVFSTSESKRADSERLGAKHFILTKDENALKAAANSFDLILDTVSATHDIIPLVRALKIFGVLAVVGAPTEPYKVAAFDLLIANKSIVGSTIGGIKETQEMLDFCAEHNIVSDIEVIPFSKVDEAYDRTVKSDVKYRFVLDIQTLPKQ